MSIIWLEQSDDDDEYDDDGDDDAFWLEPKTTDIANRCQYLFASNFNFLGPLSDSNCLNETKVSRK